MGFFTKKLTPLTYKEVVGALKRLGFEMQPKKGTSHEQWVLITEKHGKHKVTVDKHESPFTETLIKSMAHQAGMNAREFHALCKNMVLPARINELINEVL